MVKGGEAGLLSYKMKMIIFSVGCLLVILSSSYLGYTSNLRLTILAGLIFMASICAERKYPALRLVQWIFLGTFHYFSELDWCSLLYYMLILSMIENKQRVTHTLPISMLLMFQYTIIRLSYTPTGSYTALVSLFDILTVIVVIVLYHTLIRSEAEKRQLRERNFFLAQHDPLTGLLNYEGYITALNRTATEQRPFLLILLSIQNFNGLNRDGEEHWSTVIKHISVRITRAFPEAAGISRYSGDRFAIILPESQCAEHAKERLSHLLAEDFGPLLVVYSIAEYPGTAESLQQFITIAEDGLFQQQRNKWIQSEEELFRSERLRAVGELAAGMAHEIRNPLTAIRGFLQLSRGQAYNIAPWYEVIMSEVTRVTDLTAEFLQFSKPQAKHMKPEQVTHCLERVMSLTESDAASRGHRIYLNVVNETIIVNMDRDKIVQVLINLIRNAFEAMHDPGEVHIELLHAPEQVLISITDTGSGIPEQALTQIFNPFYTTKEEGTGLGLALCQKIAQDHAGKITVRSQVGIGSTFTLHLPIMAGVS